MALPSVTAPAVTLESGNDTKLYVNASTSPVAADQVPVVGDINYQTQGQVEAVPIHSDDGYDRAVKNGLAVTLSFRTMAPGTNAVVAALVAAGDAKGASAQVLGTIEFPDGSYRSGAWIVNHANRVTPTRGTFAYDVQMTSDGTITTS
jgi:hypothetical protein